MAYKVLETFTEKNDNDRLYKAGEPYPAEDFKPTKRRLKELASDQNKYGYPFIEEVEVEEEEQEIEVDTTGEIGGDLNES